MKTLPLLLKKKRAQVWVETVGEPKVLLTLPLLLKKKRAQVWVETVIYTLIFLVMIGILMAFATPIIEKQKDKITIEKTINAMNDLDNNIFDVKVKGVGNTRESDFQIGRGNLIIDGASDKIVFEIDDSAYIYSEEYDRGGGRIVNIPGTNLKVLTVKNGDKHKITLTLDYENKMNITYSGEDVKKIFNAAPTAYRIISENTGLINENKTVNINIYDI